jgi:type I restriction enzyme R subunit
LEDLRKAFRALMPFLDPNKREIVYTQYEDYFSGTVTEQNIVYQPQKVSTYRGKAQVDTRIARLAFAELLAIEWNPLQLQFLELVIDYLSQQGVLELKMLFRPPFTDICAVGMSQLFDAPMVERIQKTIQRVNADLK